MNHDARNIWRNINCVLWNFLDKVPDSPLTWGNHWEDDEIEAAFKGLHRDRVAWRQIYSNRDCLYSFRPVAFVAVLPKFLIFGLRVSDVAAAVLSQLSVLGLESQRNSSYISELTQDQCLCILRFIRYRSACSDVSISEAVNAAKAIDVFAAILKQKARPSQ